LIFHVLPDSFLQLPNVQLSLFGPKCAFLQVSQRGFNFMTEGFHLLRHLFTRHVSDKSIRGVSISLGNWFVATRTSPFLFMETTQSKPLFVTNNWQHVVPLEDFSPVRCCRSSSPHLHVKFSKPWTSVLDSLQKQTW
jgi:hypothetical protein